MLWHQQPLSVRVIVEGSIYQINVKKPALQSLRDICRAALIQHLAVIFEIEEHEAKLMEDKKSIKIIKVQQEGGPILPLNDTFKESGLAGGSLLRITIKIIDDELSERVRSLSLRQVEESAHLNPGSSSSDSTFILEVSINGHSSKIGVGSRELLRDVCQSAVVSYIKKIHQMTQEDAVAMIESQRINVFSVEEGGKVLDLDKTVFRSGIFGGATLNVTLTGLTSDPPLSDDEITKPSLELSISSQTFQVHDIRKATNDYSKKNIVGKGGQATVYKGSLFGSMVAVKKYQSLDFTDMKREIEVLQKVRHPNVILLMGYCREEKVMVSEFMEGGSLLDRLRDKLDRWSWVDRYRMVEDIVSALYFLHRSNIVHKDMKPANILFDSKGTAKVADMGLAKLSSATMTTFGQAGTPGYMDPSFLISKKTSTSMDVYGLGLIILQLCTHKESVVDIHNIFDLIPQGQKRNSKFSVDLFKEAMMACDSPMPSEEMAITLLEVGLNCAEQDSKDRPTLEEVTKRLRKVKREFDMDSDWAKAMQWYTKAEEQGDSDAQFNLGYCYENGQGLEKDWAKAAQWYIKAAEQGNSDAQFNLGDFYMKGHGVEEDWAKAAQWYTESAEQGHSTAQLNLGNSYYNGQGVEKDWAKAAQWYTKASEQGDKTAQFNLGNSYYNGHGVEKDWAKAAQWYIKAAKQGNSDAQFSLGKRYYNGEGVEKDWAKAAEWFTKAAEQGNSIAQFCMGNSYYNGEGVEKDWAKAVQWYTKAAEQGYSFAQFNLGNSYYNGEGVEKDWAKAAEWFTKAAEQGNSIAQFNLGNSYYNGEGVEKDWAKAVQWYTKAAEQGNNDA